MCGGAEGFLGRGRVLPGRQRARFRIAGVDAVRVQGGVPDAVEEAGDAADAGRAPRPALIPRAHEHQEEPDGVGPVAPDEFVRVLNVAAALAHPLAVGAEDLALVEEPLERLAFVDQAQVVHGLGEEPRIEQVHDRVLGAAGVLVDGAPAGFDRLSTGAVGLGGDR